MEITKSDVLRALDIIETYQEQEKSKIYYKRDKRSIYLLKLSTRNYNCLLANGIETIGELLALDRQELRRFRNVGQKGIENVNIKLKEFGINTSPFI